MNEGFLGFNQTLCLLNLAYSSRGASQPWRPWVLQIVVCRFLTSQHQDRQLNFSAYRISSYKALPQIILTTLIIPAILITLCRRNIVFSNDTCKSCMMKYSIWNLTKFELIQTTFIFTFLKCSGDPLKKTKSCQTLKYLLDFSISCYESIVLMN